MKASVLAIAAAAGLLAGAAVLPARAGDVYVDQLTGVPQRGNNNVSPNTPSLLNQILSLGQNPGGSGVDFGFGGLPSGANGLGFTFTADGVQFPRAPASGTVSYVVQNGNNNNASADLTTGNASAQYQKGDGNTSTVSVGGYGNVAGTVQLGDNNNTALTMTGTDTTLVSAQIGNGLSLNYGISQTGVPKTIVISQFSIPSHHR
ncbi:MAG TPA: hypothetical protein VHD15_07900 [Hyphomicrobiales bacterium]|nr:hypothetical protein [Hyphomicrobiales bacterium]